MTEVSIEKKKGGKKKKGQKKEIKERIFKNSGTRHKKKENKICEAGLSFSWKTFGQEKSAGRKDSLKGNNKSQTLE